MADARNKPESGSNQRLQRSERTGFAPYSNPLDLFNRMSEEMDRLFFSNFGMPRRSIFRSISPDVTWTPRVEAFQKGDRYIVRAELPGLRKDDVEVEFTGDALVIRGERRNERQEEREGYFHSEREYGQFYRTIPLPEGVIPESAEAKFKDGVLEIAMQAPPSEVNQKRKIEVKDESENK